MKRKSWMILLNILFFCAIMSTQNSCKTGEGCDTTEALQVKTDKDGNLSSKRGKSNLFSKKDRKKMNR